VKKKNLLLHLFLNSFYCLYTVPRAALTHLIDFILIIFLLALPINR